jgi:hypothetical protein
MLTRRVDSGWESVLWASSGEGPSTCDNLPDDTVALAAVIDIDFVWAVVRVPDGRLVYLEGDVDRTWGNGGPGGVFEVADTLDELIPRMSDEGRYRLLETPC